MTSIFFAAISGSSAATAGTMTKVALPEMERNGYAPSLATGALAAGGTLGIMIPPPVGMNVFVINATARHVPIGQIFRGVWPFLASDVARLTLLILFPAIATWLVY